MKHSIFILSLLFSVQCFAQQWHLNNIDLNEEYPYEYWFQFERNEDTCSYQLTAKRNSKMSTISVIDHKSDSLPFANIKVKNLENDTETNLSSDDNGYAELNLEDGKYSIEVKALSYDTFNMEFEIQNGQQVDLNIKLGLSPELEIYQIDSKTELEETEIIEIIECVKISPGSFDKFCSDLKKYRVIRHI